MRPQGNRAPSPVTAALYSTLRAGTYRALSEDVGPHVADTDAFVLASDRDLGEVTASPQIRGVALRNPQKLPHLCVVKASIVVAGELVGSRTRGGQLAPQACLHTPLDYREAVTLVAAPLQHLKEIPLRKLVEKSRVGQENVEVHRRDRDAVRAVRH
jgi:hypothetical protein